MTDPRPPAGAGWMDLLGESLRHLACHPARSLLTALTSAVAIAVTVNVISLSYGLDEDIRRDVERFGPRTVDVGRLPVVLPGAPRAALGGPELERVRGLLADLPAHVVPRRQVTGRVRAEAAGPDEGVRVQCVATTPDYLRTLAVRPAAGRWLQVGDVGARVAVLDAALARRLFPGRALSDLPGLEVRLALPVGEHAYRVVGVLDDPLTYRELFDAFDEGQGARTLTSSLLSFRNVYLPDGTLGEGELTGISVAFDEDAALEQGVARLAGLWPRLDLNPDSLGRAPVGVFVRRDWMVELGGSTALGTTLGNFVWIVVVLVAAVMLATLHLISVRERYDEVAIRRCEGARRSDVARQITLEGVITSLVGGLGGLPLGSAAARVLRHIVEVPFRFEARYALAATGVSVLLGLLASVLPALRAARLDPARILTRRLT